MNSSESPASPPGNEEDFKSPVSSETSDKSASASIRSDPCFTPAHVPSASRREPSKIFGLPKYAASGRGSMGDYREMYPEDPYGAEAGENARVWRVYLDESGEFDDDMIRGSKDMLDVHLVFAALFSAVVTTFVVQTSQALQPNYAQTTVMLLLELVALQRSNSSDVVPSSGVGVDTLSYTSGDVWVNALWFTTLALSLATVLVAALVKQWLQEYTRTPSGPPRERALLRHTRYKALIKWKVPLIINMLPLLLHASLALFLAGLIVFLDRICPPISYIVLPLAGLTYAFYVGTHILAALHEHCSYRTPVTDALRATLLPITCTIRRFRSHWSRQSANENHRVEAPLVHTMLDSLKWLSTHCRNPTAVGIVVEAFAGWPTTSALCSDDDDDDEWRTGILSALPRLLDGHFDPEAAYDEQTCLKLERCLRSVLCITRPPPNTEALYTAWDNLVQRDWSTFWKNVVDKMSQGACVTTWSDQQLVDRLLCLRFIFDRRRARPVEVPSISRHSLTYQPHVVLNSFPITVRQLAMNPQAKLTVTVWDMLLENACRQAALAESITVSYARAPDLRPSPSPESFEWLEDMLYLFRMRITASTSKSETPSARAGVITLQTACARHTHIQESLTTYLRLALHANCWAVTLANLVQHMFRAGKSVESWLIRECSTTAMAQIRIFDDRIQLHQPRPGKRQTLDNSASQELSIRAERELGCVLILHDSLSKHEGDPRTHGLNMLKSCLEVLNRLLTLASRLCNEGQSNLLLSTLMLFSKHSLPRRLREDDIRHQIIGTYAEAAIALPRSLDALGALDALLDGENILWMVDSYYAAPTIGRALHHIYQRTSDNPIWRDILESTCSNLRRNSAEIGPSAVFTLVERCRRINHLTNYALASGSRQGIMPFRSVSGRPAYLHVTVEWLQERGIWPLHEDGERIFGPYALPFAALYRQIDVRGGPGPEVGDDELSLQWGRNNEADSAAGPRKPARSVIAFQSGLWSKIPAWLARQRRSLTKDARQVDQEKAATEGQTASRR